MRLVYLTLFIILISSCLSQKGIAIDKTEEINLYAPISGFSQIVPLYFEQFLPVSYCKDKTIDEGKCCDAKLKQQSWNRAKTIKPSAEELEELKKKFKDETYNFQILYSDKYKKIIVLFPGTRNNVSQMVKEILGFTLKDYGSDGIKCMKYFLELFQFISGRVFKSLENLYEENKAAQKYQIIFEGHSLGAATATLFAFEYAKTYLKKYGNIESPVLINYGSPNVGNKEFKKAADKLIPTVYRVVKNGDLVAAIPPKIALIDFLPVKGLAMIDKKITTLYNCGDVKTGNCKNRINPFKIKESHLNYFWNDQETNNSCETAFRIKIKEDKEDKEDKTPKFLEK